MHFSSFWFPMSFKPCSGGTPRSSAPSTIACLDPQQLVFYRKDMRSGPVRNTWWGNPYGSSGDGRMWASLLVHLERTPYNKSSTLHRGRSFRHCISLPLYGWWAWFSMPFSSHFGIPWDIVGFSCRATDLSIQLAWWKHSISRRFSILLSLYRTSGNTTSCHNPGLWFSQRTSGRSHSGKMPSLSWSTKNGKRCIGNVEFCTRTLS